MSSKILIAYFSHWGHSKAFAEIIQQLTGGDLFEIQTDRSYPAEHDPCSMQAHQEQLDDDHPRLIKQVSNMNQYDTVFIGHPIWWYREPMVIRSFWEAYDFAGKVVLPFCTSGDVGIENTEQDTRKYLPTAVVKPGLRLATHGVKNHQAEITLWLREAGGMQ